jgi:hypothetical protein
VFALLVVGLAIFATFGIDSFGSRYLKSVPTNCNPGGAAVRSMRIV